MNVVEKGALNQSLAIYDEMTQAVDERTLEIIERRRKTAVVRRRGWLVRRALVLADVTGLLLAFIVAEIVVGPGEHPNSWNEIIAFLLTLPGWVLGAKLYGLYDNDEETDQSLDRRRVPGCVPPRHRWHLGLLPRCLDYRTRRPGTCSSWSSSGVSRSA